MIVECFMAVMKTEKLQSELIEMAARDNSHWEMEAERERENTGEWIQQAWQKVCVMMSFSITNPCHPWASWTSFPPEQKDSSGRDQSERCITAAVPLTVSSAHACAEFVIKRNVYLRVCVAWSSTVPDYCAAPRERACVVVWGAGVCVQVCCVRRSLLLWSRPRHEI